MKTSKTTMKSKSFIICTLLISAVLLVGFAGITVYVDPLFHFHGPSKGIQYPLYDERYMNDGIVRHYQYDCIMTGTSLTENFNPSIFDEQFGTNTVKVPFSGASYKEVNDIVEKALKEQPNLKYVVRGLDGNKLISDKDSMNYEDYPDYLYDNNLFNDVKYVLNKDLYVKYTEYVFAFMRLGGNSTTFDTYKNWAGLYEYGRDAILSGYERPDIEEEKELSEEDVELLMGNLMQNVISPAVNHPDVEFYYIVPPYSIFFYDDLSRHGELNRYIDAWQIAFNEMVKYSNIHLYSYSTKPEIVENLNYYMDIVHYNQEVSNYIIESLAGSEDQITQKNVAQHFARMRDHYLRFDYDALFDE